MSNPPDDEQDEIFSGPALATDGALRPATGVPLLSEVPALPEDSPAGAQAPTTISPPWRHRTAPPTPEGPPRLDPLFEQEAVAPVSPAFAGAPPFQLAEVELAERPPPPQPDFEPPPTRPQRPVRYASPDIAWGTWLVRALVLGALGAGGWVVATGKLPALKGFSFDLLGWKPKGEVTEKRVGTPAPSLLVLSEPSGAKVFIGGVEVGVTPWAGDNVWPKEPLRVEVRKAGYRPWQGVTMGGQQATLEANLRRN